MGLVGKRVRHCKTGDIGKIRSEKKGKIVVDFEFYQSTFIAPDCFASILEIEDEQEQEKLKKVGFEKSFDSFTKLYTKLINNEISYMKHDLKRKYRAIEGTVISKKPGSYIYSFETDNEYHFMNDAPLRIWRKEDVIGGTILGSEDFTLSIHTDTYLGDKVAEIYFTVDQTLLLEKLTERLMEMDGNENPIASEIANGGKGNILENQRILLGSNQAEYKATKDNITFIWGPPGTGKTHSLAKIAYSHIQAGRRVLMLSYSNVSVDGALLRVNGISDLPEGRIIRYGYARNPMVAENDQLSSFRFTLKKHPELEKKRADLINKKKNTDNKSEEWIQINKKLNQIRNSLIESEREVICKADFVATTVSKAVIDGALYNQKFDVVIFDEASMALVPQIVFSAGLAKSFFICLGDFRQLPAIVQNKENEQLKRDIFDYVGIEEAVSKQCGHRWLVMLNTQYRMHYDISEFASKYMYDGLLNTADGIREEREQIAKNPPIENEAMTMLDLSGTYSVCVKTQDGGNSRINPMSAFISIYTALCYVELGYEVGIITPYAGQVRLLLALIRDIKNIDQEKVSKITCATVHQFQGSQEAVIIYDAVDCYRMKYIGGMLSSLKDDTANRLFNVALTRTQGKFLLIGNYDYFRRKSLSKKLMFRQAMDKIKRDQACIDMESYFDEFTRHTNDLLNIGDTERLYEKFLEDIHLAKKRIKISMPGKFCGNEKYMVRLEDEIRNAKVRGVNVIVFHEEETKIPEFLSEQEELDDYVTLPITIIDDLVVWYGQPLCEAEFISTGETIPTEHKIAIRFEGKYTARILRSYV